MQQIRVLVVDDSAFMRRAITKMLESEPEITVCATARNGEDAVNKALAERPDIITMDVEMPGIGGLEAVREIVAQHKVPIIMVSALTREGADTTFRALEAGAVDFIPKPDSAYVNIGDVARDLIAKVRTFARRGAQPLAGHRTDVSALRPEPQRRVDVVVEPVRERGARSRYDVVAIGTSTGGPVALSRLVPALPEHFATPMIIVQHMPLGFTRPLAERLNSLSKVHVREAEEGMTVQAGVALIIPSGKQVRLQRTSGEVTVHLRDDDGKALHVPSVDVMTETVSDMYGSAAIGVIMTGMGQDGVTGLRRLKERGGYVIGQDEATCVVYGMPRAAARAGLVDRVAPLDHIPGILCDLTGSIAPR